MTARAPAAVAALSCVVACCAACAGEAFVPCGPEAPAPLSPWSSDVSPRARAVRAVADARVTIVFVPEGYLVHELDAAAARAQELLAAALADDAGILGRVAEHVAARVLELPSATRELRDADTGDTALGGCVRADAGHRDGRLEVSLARARAAVRDALPGVRVDAIVVLLATGGRPTTHGEVILLGRGAGPPSFVHELGHALVGLGDEYAEGDACWSGPAPVFTTWPDPFATPNLTLDARGAKWRALVDGAEPGGDGAARCIHHPPGACRMKDRREPRLCPVCEHAVAGWVAAVRDNDGPPRCDLALDTPPDRVDAARVLSIDLMAADLDGVQGVELTLDGAPLLSRTRSDVDAAPAWLVDTRARLSPGAHELGATCRDREGRVGTRRLRLHVM